MKIDFSYPKEAQIEVALLPKPGATTNFRPEDLQDLLNKLARLQMFFDAYTRPKASQPVKGSVAPGVKAIVPNDSHAARAVHAAAGSAMRRDEGTGATMTSNSTCRTRPAPSRGRARSSSCQPPASPSPS